MSAVLILNQCKYKLVMFSDGRRKTEIVNDGLKSYLSRKSPMLAWARKLRLKKVEIFVLFFVCLFS